MGLTNLTAGGLLENHLRSHRPTGGPTLPIRWIDQGKVNIDAEAFYLVDAHGLHFVFLVEDFPDGTPFGDDLSHEVVWIDGQISAKFGPGGRYITLFKERENRPDGSPVTLES